MGLSLDNGLGEPMVRPLSWRARFRSAMEPPKAWFIRLSLVVLESVKGTSLCNRGGERTIFEWPRATLASPLQ